ncbi:hypothetical protein ACHHYP_00943 [Achlya hypogyna]|uniref:Transmembrane protein n=1 Tax=Achlya hypogyna TaxID=1202772 RepID=A0A1V9Z9T6_ACHHY|nr:hypothetical protein ACHHYP_00943 [Achlya hypogyna]
MSGYQTIPEAPQAVPVQPVYPAYNGAAPQQQAYGYPPQQTPLYVAQQYPPATAVYGSNTLPMHHVAERQHECGFFSASTLVSNICNTTMLVVLQFFSMFVAIFSFIFVLLGLVLGVGLLPVCCIGILIFGIFTFCLRPVASIDDMLYQQRRRIYERLLAD